MKRKLTSLMARAAEEDSSAVSDLFDAQSARVFSICRAMLPLEAEAEAAMAEVFAHIKSGAEAPPDLDPTVWITDLTRQVAAAQRQMALHASPGEVGAATRLGRALAAMPDRRGEAIRAAYFDGAGYAVIAADFGIPLGQVRGWLRGGLESLMCEAADE